MEGLLDKLIGGGAFSEGLLDKLTGGGACSEGDVSVVDGLENLPPILEALGRLSLLLARRPGMTLLRIPRPVNVSPLSGSRIGW